MSESVTQPVSFNLVIVRERLDKFQTSGTLLYPLNAHDNPQLRKMTQDGEIKIKDRLIWRWPLGGGTMTGQAEVVSIQKGVNPNDLFLELRNIQVNY
mgnify:CR=1 FL=1